jgi:hypothetical protein
MLLADVFGSQAGTHYDFRMSPLISNGAFGGLGAASAEF